MKGLAHAYATVRPVLGNNDRPIPVYVVSVTPNLYLDNLGHVTADPIRHGYKMARDLADAWNRGEIARVMR